MALIIICGFIFIIIYKSAEERKVERLAGGENRGTSDIRAGQVSATIQPGAHLDSGEQTGPVEEEKVC